MFDISPFISIADRFGVGFAQFLVLLFLLWKIATNHLKHIADDITDMKESVGGLVRDVRDVKNSLNDSQQRISRLEGKLE